MENAKATKIPEVIVQTWAMVNEGHVEIGWNHDGTQVIVANAERLAEHG